MTISVIIPTYNRSTFLTPAVRSVLHQSTPALELIIVDDGSTDNTPHLIKALAGKSIVPIRSFSQENKGAAAARNTGIRAARGKFLCFLDSDDRFAPHKLALQYEQLRTSRQLISHTRETWYRRGELLRQKRKHLPPHGDIFKASLGMCVVGMSTVMARRELFDMYGLFDESLPCCEDYEYWLRISPFEHFLLVDEPLTVKHGGRPDQLSVRYRQGMDRYRIRALVKLLENISLSERRRAQAIEVLERKCTIYGRGCIKHGRVEEGEKYLKIPEQLKKGERFTV